MRHRCRLCSVLVPLLLSCCGYTTECSPRNEGMGPYLLAVSDSVYNVNPGQECSSAMSSSTMGNLFTRQ